MHMKKQALIAAIAMILSVQALPVFPRETGDIGAYDRHHRWHDTEWWHTHHPQWMYEHHPEWAEPHAEWRNDGDFDEHRRWHRRNWWLRNHRDWVKEHHADWSD